MKITKRTVDALKPEARGPCFVWDSTLSGCAGLWTPAPIWKKQQICPAAPAGIFTDLSVLDEAAKP